MQYKNYIKFSLFECKICDDDPSNQNLGTYKIKISFNQQIVETEKISSNYKEFKGGKCYYFEIPNNTINNETLYLEISAIGTSWMVFNSTLCSLFIPFFDNINNFNDQKQNYYLKNKKGNNIIAILSSIWCEYSSNNNNSITNNDLTFNNGINKTFCNNNNFSNSRIIGDISSYELSGNLNNTMVNRNNFVHHFYNNSKDSTNSNNNLNDTSTNTILDNNLGENNNHHNSTFSPYSERINITNLVGINNISNFNNNKKNNNNNYDILGLIDAYVEKNNGNVDMEIIEKLRNQAKTLKEREESLKNQQLKDNELIKKMKEKENNLNKEKTNLEEKIKKFKKEQNDFNKKNISINQSTLYFEQELSKHLIEKEISNQSNNLFYNLNYFIATGQDIPIIIQTEKINKQNYILNNNSNNDNLNNQDLENKKYKKEEKKELILETVTKYIPQDKNQKNKIKIHPPVAQINLNFYDYQTPKNEKYFENKLLDSLESNFTPHNKNIDNKKGKIMKRNNNENNNFSKFKNNKTNITTTTSQVNRTKINVFGNNKNPIKRDKSQNKNEISMSGHKAFSHKKKGQINI